VAAELEEVVVNADRIDPQNLAPDAADLRLALIPGRLVRVEQVRTRVPSVQDLGGSLKASLNPRFNPALYPIPPPLEWIRR
jgi:hypothetical protein